MSRAVTTAEIVAVGSELLTAHRVDTNSLFLTGVLNDLGISVRAKHVVGDTPSDLAAVTRAALARSGLVITTGGLGPTDDDLTRQVVADVLDRHLEADADLLAAIEERFSRRGIPMPSVNRRQAQVIAGAAWLANPNGTAPGQWIDVDDRVVVLLPGPPRELQPMFQEHVVPRLVTRTAGRRVHRRVLKTTGRSESQIEEVTQPIYSRLVECVPPIDTTILASPGLVELHLSCSGPDAAALDAALEDAVVRLAAAIGDAAFSLDGRALEDVVGHQLQTRRWRIAAAESCTGGLLLKRLTDVPGSSAWVLGGIVAYDNRVKIGALGVSEQDLAAHGAVSELVVRAMAEGVRTTLGAEVGVAITGIAGPGGGTVEKPVGTVHIAVAAAGRSDARRFRFPGDRAMVRLFSASAALDMVRRQLDD